MALCLRRLQLLEVATLATDVTAAKEAKHIVLRVAFMFTL